MAVGLHVADHGLDGGATSQFAFDDAEHAALLSGDENAVWVCGIAAAVALVDIGALDVAAGEPFGGGDDGAERVAVVRIAQQRLGVQDELTARRAGIAGDDRSLYAELVGRAGLALADTPDRGRALYQSILLQRGRLLIRRRCGRPSQTGCFLAHLYVMFSDEIDRPCFDLLEDLADILAHNA